MTWQLKKNNSVTAGPKFSLSQSIWLNGAPRNEVQHPRNIPRRHLKETQSILYISFDLIADVVWSVFCFPTDSYLDISGHPWYFGQGDPSCGQERTFESVPIRCQDSTEDRSVVYRVYVL